MAESWIRRISRSVISVFWKKENIIYIYYEKESVFIFRTKLIRITLENIKRQDIFRNWMYETKILNDANINM